MSQFDYELTLYLSIRRCLNKKERKESFIFLFRFLLQSLSLKKKIVKMKRFRWTGNSYRHRPHYEEEFTVTILDIIKLH